MKSFSLRIAVPVFLLWEENIRLTKPDTGGVISCSVHWTAPNQETICVFAKSRPEAQCLRHLKLSLRG